LEKSCRRFGWAYCLILQGHAVQTKVYRSWRRRPCRFTQSKVHRPWRRSGSRSPKSIDLEDEDSSGSRSPKSIDLEDGDPSGSRSPKSIDLEDGDSKPLRKVGNYLPVNMASGPRELDSSSAWSENIDSLAALTWS
jgi:hypothetical protein